MLKLIGAISIFMGSGLVGLTVGNNYSQRPEQLKSLRASLAMLESEIAYTSTPLPEALWKVAKHTRHPMAVLFYHSSAQLQSKPGCTAEEAWENAVLKLGHSSALTPSDLEVLYQFGRGLGETGKEEQIKSLQLTKEYLKKQESVAESERVKHERIWKTMGFLVGLAVVLILY